MSSGKRHAQASLVLSVPLAVLVYAKTHNVELAVSAGVGCGFVGQLSSPDLDDFGITRSEWSAVRWFKIVGVAWVALWLPYGYIFKHRRAWSHAPVIGTAGRVAYMMIPLLILGVSVPVNVWTVGGVIGLGVSDLAHWVMDRFGGRK